MVLVLAAAALLGALMEPPAGEEALSDRVRVVGLSEGGAEYQQTMALVASARRDWEAATGDSRFLPLTINVVGSEDVQGGPSSEGPSSCLRDGLDGCYSPSHSTAWIRSSASPAKLRHEVGHHLIDGTAISARDWLVESLAWYHAEPPGRAALARERSAWLAALVLSTLPCDLGAYIEGEVESPELHWAFGSYLIYRMPQRVQWMISNRDVHSWEKVEVVQEGLRRLEEELMQNREAIRQFLFRDLGGGSRAFCLDLEACDELGHEAPN